MTISTMIQPQSVELEQAFLGSLLIDPDAMVKVSHLIHPNDFYIEKHAWIYEAARSIQERNDPLEFLSITSELEKKNRLNAVGGSAYIVGLLNVVPSALNVEYYAKEILNLSGKRKMIGLAGVLAEDGYNGKSFDECLTNAQSKLLALMPKSKRGATDIDSLVANRVLEYMLRDNDPRDVAGVSTGYTAMDRITRGLDVGLHVWQAEPSNGKTTLALNVIARMAREHNTHSAMFTLEMTPGQLVDRLVAMECGINSTTLAMGKLNGNSFTPEIIKRRQDAAYRVSLYDVQIEYVGGMTTADIRSRIIYHAMEHGTQIAFVDYLQNILSKGNQNRTLELDEASRVLNDTANELGIPIVALSQVSRDKLQRGQVPGMDRPRDSGGIEQNAGCLASIVYDDRNHLFDPLYIPDRVITFNGLKDRLHGVCINAICGFRIDETTSKLTEIPEMELTKILRERKTK